MRIEEIVGQRVRERREELGLSQTQFGKLIGSRLGRDWSRQTVSAVESGDRNFAAAELVILARVLEVSVGHLLTPPADVEVVEVAPGVSAGRDEVVLALAPAMGEADEAEADLHEALTKLVNDSRLIRFAAESMHVAVENMQQTMDTIQRLSMTIAQAGESPTLGEEILEQQPVATAIVTSSRGVLVGNRHDQKPPWTFIAGEVEPGETPEFAAVREVKEETGLEARPRGEIGRRVHPKTGRTMIYIAAEPVRPGELDVFVGDSEELAEVRWVSLAEADELMAAYGMFDPVHAYLQGEIGE